MVTNWPMLWTESPETSAYELNNWVYQNTDSMLLAGILEEASGQSIRRLC